MRIFYWDNESKLTRRWILEALGYRNPLGINALVRKTWAKMPKNPKTRLEQAGVKNKR